MAKVGCDHCLEVRDGLQTHGLTQRGMCPSFATANPLRKKFAAALEADDEMEDVPDDELDEVNRMARQMAEDQAEAKAAYDKTEADMKAAFESGAYCYVKWRSHIGTFDTAIVFCFHDMEQIGSYVDGDVIQGYLCIFRVSFRRCWRGHEKGNGSCRSKAEEHVQHQRQEEEYRAQGARKYASTTECGFELVNVF